MIYRLYISAMFIYKLTNAGPILLEDKEKDTYVKMSRTYCAIEISLRTVKVRGNVYYGSVAGYNPNGNSIRVWGTKLINGTVPALWKEYSRLSSAMGASLTKKQTSMLIEILTKYKSNPVGSRLVIFYK